MNEKIYTWSDLKPRWTYRCAWCGRFIDIGKTTHRCNEMLYKQKQAEDLPASEMIIDGKIRDKPIQLPAKNKEINT